MSVDAVINVLKKEGILRGDGIILPKPMSHGPCCGCRDCGQYHDECVCDSNRLWTLINAALKEYHNGSRE